MLICHKCNQIIFAWVGTRGELAPSGKHHNFFHPGCYAELEMERKQASETLASSVRKEVNISE